jgi:capsular polysaccharide biosynthesis protein
MEIRKYLRIVRRHVLLVAAIVVAAMAAGWFVSPRNSSYTSTSTLYVGSRSVDIEPASGEISGDYVAGLDRLLATFATMATTRPVAAEAAERAGISRSADDVAAQTVAAQLPETNLIEVAVTDGDPATSQALAAGVATAMVNQVRAFEPRANRAPSEQAISVYERASDPVANPPDTTRYVILAGLFGLLAAAALVALLEHMDVTLRSPEDVERQLELPVLAVVPGLGRELPIPPSGAVRSDA